jgi:hypothetical protein
MKIYEYRIVLPTNVDKYKIGNLYMCVKRTRETRGGGEGIEVKVNEPYENAEETGQYTHKIMHFKSKVPGFVRWAVPDKYMHLHEKSHNGYPHFHTEYELPGMGKDFYMLVESQHYPYNKAQGCPDNCLNLPEDELKQRKVVWLDVVYGKPDPEQKSWKLEGFTCPEAGITQPLAAPKKTRDESKVPCWVQHYNGELMICVKVVKFRFKWLGLQTAVEKYAVNTAYHDIFLESNRALMAWAKEWYPLSIEDIRRMENELQEEQQTQHFDRDEESSK